MSQRLSLSVGFKNPDPYYFINIKTVGSMGSLRHHHKLCDGMKRNMVNVYECFVQLSWLKQKDVVVGHETNWTKKVSLVSVNMKGSISYRNKGPISVATRNWAVTLIYEVTVEKEGYCSTLTFTMFEANIPGCLPAWVVFCTKLFVSWPQGKNSLDIFVVFFYWWNGKKVSWKIERE